MILIAVNSSNPSMTRMFEPLPIRVSRVRECCELPLAVCGRGTYAQPSGPRFKNWCVRQLVSSRPPKDGNQTAPSPSVAWEKIFRPEISTPGGFPKRLTDPAAASGPQVFPPFSLSRPSLSRLRCVTLSSRLVRYRRRHLVITIVILARGPFHPVKPLL